MTSSNIGKVKGTVTSLLPNEEYRMICLALFLQALNKANSYCSNKWGIHYLNDGVHLLVGNLIVFTIHKNRIWLALDKQLLKGNKNKRDLLDKSELWSWDDGS